MNNSIIYNALKFSLKNFNTKELERGLASSGASYEPDWDWICDQAREQVYKIDGLENFLIKQHGVEYYDNAFDGMSIMVLESIKPELKQEIETEISNYIYDTVR